MPHQEPWRTSQEGLFTEVTHPDALVKPLEKVARCMSAHSTSTLLLAKAITAWW
jgi:hypothetical protein